MFETNFVSITLNVCKGSVLIELTFFLNILKLSAQTHKWIVCFKTSHKTDGVIEKKNKPKIYINQTKLS